jgi:serpin B
MNDHIDQHQHTLTAKSINRLGFSLYRELATESNLVFSPLGIYCVLRMLQEGARGETRRAISQLLCQDSEPVSTDGFQSLMDQLQATFQVSIANGIWIQDGYGFKPEFIAQIQKLMQVQAENLDFAGHPAQACESINAWVAEQTNGKIETLLSPADISELTRGILGNALHFKASWEREFADPSPGNFYLLDGSQIDVPMMPTYWNYNYVQHDDFWAVELPYQNKPKMGSSFSMILAVPTALGIEALRRVENHLSNHEVLLSEAARKSVSLTMPPFNITGGGSLTPVLAGLGLERVFKTGADFTGISTEFGFRADKIFQSSYIKVDQYGTEAAAVVFAEFVGGIEEFFLTIDRPFLFMLVDKESGLILFQGKVVNPLAG